MLVDLDLEGQPVLAVGAGQVAARRLPQVLAAGARLTVVAPGVDPRVAALADTGRLALERRPWQPDDHRHPWRLVLSLVDDPQLDAAILEAARAAGQLVSSARGGGDIRHVSERRWQEMRIGVGSGGRDPGGSRALADHLVSLLGDPLADPPEDDDGRPGNREED